MHSQFSWRSEKFAKRSFRWLSTMFQRIILEGKAYWRTLIIIATSIFCEKLDRSHSFKFIWSASGFYEPVVKTCLIAMTEKFGDVWNFSPSLDTSLKSFWARSCPSVLCKYCFSLHFCIELTWVKSNVETHEAGRSVIVGEMFSQFPHLLAATSSLCVFAEFLQSSSRATFEYDKWRKKEAVSLWRWRRLRTCVKKRRPQGIMRGQIWRSL
jgi:hypothetical protein